MKKHLILFVAWLIGGVATVAQESDYEAWSKRKQDAYTAWKKKQRSEVEALPASAEQAAISGFIEEGFGNVAVGGAGHHAATANPQPYTQPIATRPTFSANMRVWVVVVGIADYQRIGKLNYTDDDAYRMYAYYKSPEGGGLPDNQIRVLIDEDATRNNVMRAMQDIYSQAGSSDAIVFYFSGHGARDAFVLWEYNGPTPNRRGLLLHEELHTLFEQSPAKYKYIIADACHSGSSGQQGVKSASATEQHFYQTFEQSQGGFVMLLSSMSNEYSLETSGIRQGVFTHFLIRGLKGEADTNKDRIVSVVELFDYVESNVSTYTKRRQNPVLSGDYTANPPIAVVAAAG
jgi:hypothetical protein